MSEYTREHLEEIRAKMAEKSIARTWTIPSQGYFPMGCGNCGCQQFRVDVKPIDTTARIGEVVCTQCNKGFRVTDEGIIDAQGKLSL